MKTRSLAFAILLILGLSACGGSKTFGGGIGQDVGGGGRLEDVLTKTPTAKATATATARPTASKTSTVDAEKIASIKVSIDIEGFKPSDITIKRSGIVLFKNDDSQPRSVVSPNGGFRSPTLKPGESWSYKADSVGSFDLQDGTRPYVVGKLRVVQ